jgi:hypothetical protein
MTSTGAFGRDVRRGIAIAVGVLMPFLGLSGMGSAQQAVQVEGVIEAVDCQADTVVLGGPTGANTVAAAAYTAVLINSTSVPFCTLQNYVGAPATAWLVATGSQFTATRIDVTGPAAAPAPTEVGVAPVPIWGVVLGTVVVAGLVYLLVHGPDGGYYRYPYYGDYYRHYYHPEYRPYLGAYPASAPVVTVAAAIAGTVLGIVLINNLQYVLTRDAAGHLYRYPYYGPYRQVYYRPAYRPYQGPEVQSGAFRNAQVRQGDPQWDAPLRPMPGPRPVPVKPQGPVPYRQPAPQTPRQPAPTPQPVPIRPPAPAYQVPPRPQPPAPAYQVPAQPRPPVPAYQVPTQPRPPVQRPAAPTVRPPVQRPAAPTVRPPIPQQPGRPGCGGPNQPPCPGGGAPGAPPANRQPPARR